MTYLLAVDPGQAACGAALFRDGRLIACSWVRHPGEHDASLESLRTMAREVCCWARVHAADGAWFDSLALVVEWPKVYPGARGQGDPDDLMPLCGIVTAIAAFLPHSACEYFRPRDWKGTLPKPVKPKGKPWPPYVVEERVKARFDPDELLTYFDGTDEMGDATRHNVADAVGIGMHASGRSIVDMPKRVRPR